MTVLDTTPKNRKFERSLYNRKHDWITVVNPMNHRLLLQACDNCGVVKSENSVIRRCKAKKGRAVISGSMINHQPLAI